MKMIPVASPVLNGNESLYVKECLESTWVSSAGRFIGLFEAEFARFCGVKHAVSCSNGTAALHLSLLAHDLRPGDEVIIPTLTYVATANCVHYCGATPVFVDCEPETWNIDPGKIEAAVTPRTRGIIVVHLYGHPVDLDPVLALADKYGLFVVEDAAEAHGAEYKGRRVGSIGHVAAFSFFGNKIITTGEGGMLTTNDDALAAKMRQLRGQGVDPGRRYWFPQIGYNYRMTNIEAAIGLAQMENIGWHLAQRRRVVDTYRERLGHCPDLLIQPEKPWAQNSYWMVSVVLGDRFPEREVVMDRLLTANIETRPFFYPMHVLPIYRDLALGKAFPVADAIYPRGLSLPSSGCLTTTEIDYVCEHLLSMLR